MEQMNDQEVVEMESWLRQTADSFPYPPTPDVITVSRYRSTRRTRQHMVRRLAWGLVVWLIIGVVLLITPPARAALFYFLQIGAVQIEVGAPRATAVSPSPSPSTPSVTLADIAGETSLNIAQGRADFTLQIPTYPPDLGLPDKVYWQEQPPSPGQTIIFVWLQEGQSEQAWLSLYQMGEDEGAFKQGIESVQETEVNGAWAIWVEGAHTLKLRNGRWQPWLFVMGNVLIWQEADITYRLESSFSLEAAIQVAESLQEMGN